MTPVIIRLIPISLTIGANFYILYFTCSMTTAIGIIGGSGIYYHLEGLTDPQEMKVTTPFGDPSDTIHSGLIHGRRVYFLPRHGKGHRLLPTELNHRANIYALRSLDVRWIISIGAVGSLQETYQPEHLVLPDQFFDRTHQTPTFFGDGIVAHVGFGDPTSAQLRQIIETEARSLGYPVHQGGTYVNIDGPSFSTRAESQFYRQLHFDVIGMTNLPEAKLAREAEIAFASMSFVTDYDSWKTEETPVEISTIASHLQNNANAAKKILPGVIAQIPLEPNEPAHRALETALITEMQLWPDPTVKKLGIILERFI
jgi:5'-methylthioadenosine phosphorylase